MTPAGLAALALEQADLRNQRRQARLFHQETYADADRLFTEAITAAAAQLAGPDGEEETPRKAAPRRRR
jgi:hypothetical protein